MLQAITSLAPRGVYVCGSYSSSAGLTVTLQREKGTGDFAIEAGMQFSYSIKYIYVTIICFKVL